MRTLGPGSVSSFLKIILDVVFAALAAGLGLAVIMSIVGAVLISDPTLLDPTVVAELRAQGLFGPTALLALVAAAIYVAGVMTIVGQLRRIFATLIGGDPFHPDNVGRLRMIGAMLAALEIARYPATVLFAWTAPHGAGAHFGFNPTVWFAVLVVFVLAEVFREGARLRREAELTI